MRCGCSPDEVLGIQDGVHGLRAGEEGLSCGGERDAVAAAHIARVHDMRLAEPTRLRALPLLLEHRRISLQC